MCFRKPVGEDEVMEMNAALAESRDFTAEDLEAFPEDVRAEVIDGQIFCFAAPKVVHQKLVIKLGSRLDRYIEEHSGKCQAFVAPIAVRLYCDNKTSLEPDVIAVCDEEKLHEDACYGAPDLVIEIVSRSTRKRDYGLKLMKYRTAGVKEYWIVDPERETVLVNCFADECETCLYSFDDEVCFHLFPELGICIRELIK